MSVTVLVQNMAYKYYCFFRKEVFVLKEIGEKLKEAREAIGISTTEAASDLKMRLNQIEDIENGNMDAFKDLHYLKYFIRDYAKYLGLDYDDLVDEFNEYLFDYTSKISLDDIRKAKKKIKEQEKKEPKKKISSPYTMEYKKKLSFSPIVLWAMVVLIVLTSVFLIVTLWPHDDFVPNNTIAKTRERNLIR